MNKQYTNFFLDRTLLILIFLFPLIIILRSATINTATILISIIMLFYIYKKIRIDFFRDKLVIYVLSFFLFIFINSIIHFTSFELFLKSIGNFRYLLLSAAVFFVLKKLSKKEKIFYIYFNAIIIFLIQLDILYQFIFGKDIFGFTPGMCEIICLRFSGVFGDELIAGSYLSQIGFLILLLFLSLNKSYYNLLIKFFLFLFFFAIILLTGERAALLIVLISLFFIFYFKKKIINFLYIFLFLLTIIFFSSKKIENINIRFINLFNSWNSVKSEELTIINKININPWMIHYKAAIELFIDKPIIGHGPKSFRIKCENTNIQKKYINEEGYSACSTHPHNYLLEFLSEHGLIGGLFFIGLFYFVFIRIYKVCKNKKNENMLMFVVTGSLILAIIFPLKPSGSFFSTFNASMLFYIFGFFLYYLEKAE